jgi:hypothetical protein
LAPVSQCNNLLQRGFIVYGVIYNKIWGKYTEHKIYHFFLFCFVFCVVVGFELRVYTLSHSTSPF